jgi:hypothetical protein
MTIADTTTPTRPRREANPQLDEKVLGTFYVPTKDHAFTDDVYAVILDGHCLDPIIKDGNYAVCEPHTPFSVGDFVALWPKDPAKIPVIKRLVIAPPWDWQKWTHPESEAVPACIVEMLNPHRQFRVDLSRIAAIHRVVSWGNATEIIDPRAARRAGGAA